MLTNTYAQRVGTYVAKHRCYICVVKQWIEPYDPSARAQRVASAYCDTPSTMSGTLHIEFKRGLHTDHIVLSVGEPSARALAVESRNTPNAVAYVERNWLYIGIAIRTGYNRGPVAHSSLRPSLCIHMSLPPSVLTAIASLCCARLPESIGKT